MIVREGKRSKVIWSCRAQRQKVEKSKNDENKGDNTPTNVQEKTTQSVEDTIIEGDRAKSMGSS